MHSIRVKIAALTLAAIFTSMLAVFLVSRDTVRTEQDRRSVENMNLLAQNTQRALEKYTGDIEQSVEMAAIIARDRLDGAVLVECGVAGRDAGHGARTPEQIRRLDDYLTDYCDDIQESFRSIARQTQGVMAYHFCISPDVSQKQRGFYYSRVGRTGFDVREPLNPHIAEGERDGWYYKPVQRGRPTWAGLHQDERMGGAWADSYLVPLYKAGSFIGVLGMDIPLETLIGLVRPIRVYDTGFACLFDEAGNVVYHPELPTGSRLEAAEVSDVSEAPTGHDSGERLIRYSTHGIERQMAYTRLSNGMLLVVTAPVAEINAAWTRLSHLILPMAAGIIVSFAGLLLLMLRLVIAPLRKLTEASRRLSDGDYDVALDYRGRDEVGQLTSAFVRMRDRQKAYIQDLNRQLYTDALTGLPNMRGFFRLAHDREAAIREAGGHAVMLYFDLTDMKHYNRQHGFEAGDRLLCELGEILARHYGRDGVCRYGDDHFAAVSEEARVEEELQSIFVEWETAGEVKRPPIRVGIYPRRLEAVDVNLACDRAKYACGQCVGRLTSSCCYYDEKMLNRVEKTRYVISHLDQALREGWVKVYHQPIIRAANDRICDEEALARWIDPVQGFMSPADFIPALEDTRLIYRLDLYVVDRVLEKLKKQAALGMYTVSQSINLSRNDFDSCDVVEEIRRRVDEAGLPRSLLNIEITESVIGSDFDFIKVQVERFRALGFQVWMDDFGSGYSSLDVLQNIHFDLIKFDMRFMERFGEGDEGKVILTELMKMAIGLGVETICEGVERADQVEFLREIGCTKIQGYYFGKPRPFEDTLARFEKGEDTGYENPAEAEYYATLGRINLYDMSVIAGDGDESFRRYFDTLPMAIIEVQGNRMRYNRCNRSYHEFLRRAYGRDFSDQVIEGAYMDDGHSAAFLNAVLKCSQDGNRAILDEPLSDRITMHAFIRRVAVNPVTGTVAVAVVVLSVLESDPNAGASYAHIARALASDYIDLYYVDLETERFIEYSCDPTQGDLAVERRGEDFFGASQRDARRFIYREDQDYFVEAFTREKVLDALDEHGAFVLTYRLDMDGTPLYVSMKAVRMRADQSHIVIGISNVDAQMRQQQEVERIRAEQITFARVKALSNRYICIYTVNPETGRYVEYSATPDFEGLGLAKEGEAFFDQCREQGRRFVYPGDWEKYRTLFTRERVMEAIEKDGIYALQYRLMLNGVPCYVRLKAAMVEEQDGPHLIVGISNIDDQMRREQSFAGSARGQ